MNAASQFRALLIYAAAAIAIDGCAPPLDESPKVEPIGEIVSSPVSESELLASFERSDAADIVFALNEVKKSPLDFDVVRAVACAYTECGDHRYSWNWAAMSHPLVRANLIDVLVQADQRGISTVNPIELRDDVVTLLYSPNPLVVQRSLFVISYIDDSRDIPLIIQTARSTKDEVTFRCAIIALKQMSGAIARDAITAVLNDASVAERKAVADLTSGLDEAN